MLGWSRRHALRTAAGALAAVLAGCSGTSDGSNDGPRVVRERVTDVEVATARNTDGDPLFVAGDGETAPDEDARSGRVREIHHLTDDSERQRLRFRDGTADLEPFVTATDLDSKSVYLVQGPMGECYVPRLDGVYIEGEGVDVSFTRELRPAGFECAVDTCDVVAVAVRLPFPGDDFGSIGFGPWGSDCESRPALPRPAGGGGT